LSANDFLVGLSIDGPPIIHDTYRVSKKGKTTSNKVESGLTILKKYKVKFNILVCVHASNVNHPLEVYNFLKKEIGVEFIQFIPIVERDNQTGFKNGNQIKSYSVNGKDSGNFLITIFDEWVQNDVGKIFIQIFDVSLGTWFKIPPGLCLFSPTCRYALVLEHNGDIYSCDHFVKPKHKLGNIMKSSLVDLVASSKQLAFGQNKKVLLSKKCQNCEVLFVCNGGCPKNRVLYTKDNIFGLNYLCKGYKAFFTHIDPYMQFMVNQLRKNLPPADIMNNLDQLSK
jgi:uncharacterized protein